jgi:CRP/FNR family transcriptional regulator
MKELAQVPIFRRAGAGELEQLGSIAKRESFKRNSVVFFQGDRADKLYVLLSGAAKVYQQAGDGKQKIIGTLGPGEIFGELTLLDARERSATVETIEATEMLSIAHRDFHAVATKSPEILWRVIEVLCERIRGLNEETLDLAFEELPYRIVQALNQLVDKHGKPGAGGRIAIKTTPADIGKRVGADRQESNRVLKMLSKRGLVELDVDEVVIPDARALKRALEYAREWF